MFQTPQSVPKKQRISKCICQSLKNYFLVRLCVLHLLSGLFDKEIPLAQVCCSDYSFLTALCQRLIIQSQHFDGS